MMAGPQNKMEEESNYLKALAEMTSMTNLEIKTITFNRKWKKL